MHGHYSSAVGSALAFTEPPRPKFSLRHHKCEVNCVKFLKLADSSVSSCRSDAELFSALRANKSLLCSGDFLGNILIWDLVTRRPVHQIEGHSASARRGVVQHLEYSNAHNCLLAQFRKPGEGFISVWDATTLRVKGALHSKASAMPNMDNAKSSFDTQSSTFCRMAVVSECVQSPASEWDTCEMADESHATAEVVEEKAHDSDEEAVSPRPMSDGSLVSEATESGSKRKMSGLGLALRRAGISSQTAAIGSTPKKTAALSSAKKRKATTLRSLKGRLKVVCTGRKHTEVNIWDVDNECVVHSLDLEDVRVDACHHSEGASAGESLASGRWKLKRGMVTGVDAWLSVGGGITVAIASEAGVVDLYDTRAAAIYDSLKLDTCASAPSPITAFVFDKAKRFGAAVDAGPCVRPFAAANWRHFADSATRCRQYFGCSVEESTRIVSAKAGNSCVKMSADNTLLAVGSWDNRVRIFDSKTSRYLFSLSDIHTDAVTDVDFYPLVLGSQQMLATASRDSNVYVYMI